MAETQADHVTNVCCDVPIGSRFNRLSVIGVPFALRSITAAGSLGKRHINVVCECQCGTITSVRVAHLRSGRNRSCGCLAKELAASGSTTHGLSNTRLYQTWQGMKARCFNDRSVGYRHWGGRGITVCDAWKDFTVFRDWAAANGYRADLSIDRIDLNGHYEPSNCRWLSKRESGRHRSNIKLSNARAFVARVGLALGIAQNEIAKSYELTPGAISFLAQGRTWNDDRQVDSARKRASYKAP